jgi:predicted GIY-YIG superfamily endonuclease
MATEEATKWEREIKYWKSRIKIEVLINNKQSRSD